VLDENGNDVGILTTIDHPIELIIPRDPNLLVPPMSLQNATAMNGYNLSFNLHFVNLTQSISNVNLTMSLHLEMCPLNTSLGYMLIFKFDGAPQLNSSINRTDGWSLFCPSSKFNFFRQLKDSNLISLRFD
jgi:hypothetical protein